MKFTSFSTTLSISVGITAGAAAAQPQSQSYQSGTNLDPRDVEPESPILPCTQLRLAYAGDYDMTVSWNTDQESKNPEVCYGISEGALDKCIKAYTVTYPTSTTWNHHAKLSPLKADTTYYYHITNDNNTMRQFKTSPKLGEDKQWSFAFVADLGTMGKFGLSSHPSDEIWSLEPGEENTIDALIEKVDTFDFLWQGGDMGYADYWLKEQLNGYLNGTDIGDGEALYEKILNQFYQQMSPITSIKPFMVGPGNHEANCDNGGAGDYDSSICVEGQTNFTGYLKHYRMPWRESGGRSNMWYSWDYGNVHFIQYNTETDLGEGITGPEEKGGESGVDAGPFGAYENEQVDWLKKDLENVDRSKTPWVIAAGHRPWYVAAKKDDTCTDCQDAFEKVLYEGGVDVLMFGHVHNYQYILPMYNGEVDANKLDNPKYPWHILNGAAGHYDGRDKIKEDKAPKGYVKGIDDAYGWSRVTIHNATHLTHEFIESDGNNVLDAQTLFKKRD